MISLYADKVGQMLKTCFLECSDEFFLCLAKGTRFIAVKQ